MRYRKDYQYTHDIDWFFVLGGKVYHAASNGGRLPDVVDSRSNRELQIKIAQFEANFETTVVEHNIHSEENDNPDVSSFIMYASKGFISLDRTIKLEESSIEKLNYHIVAYPKNGEVIDDSEILNLLPNLSEYDINIDK